MLIIIGFIVVIGSVVGGYILSGGNLLVLIQPGEFIIILGAALGAFVASQTKYTMGLILKSFKRIFGDPASSKTYYLDTLALLYALFTKMHREGVISIESDVENRNPVPFSQNIPAFPKMPQRSTSSGTRCASI